jgi:hypothetical protein
MKYVGVELETESRAIIDYNTALENILFKNADIYSALLQGKDIESI